MRATRGGNQGTSEGDESPPLLPLYADSEPAIVSGCCNAEQNRRREWKTNREWTEHPEGLLIPRLVLFLLLFREFLHPASRPRACSPVPTRTATNHDEAHGGEDHEEQGEGP